MATTKARKHVPADPANATNREVLKQREERIAEAAKPIPDLGLNLKEKPPANAAEFLRDAWDKRAFGDPASSTVTRIIYGPDPLYDSSALLREMIQRVGLHDYAEATAQAIRKNGEMAIADPLLQRGLRSAINKFGVEQVAKAFADRILAIPSRSVEYETNDEPDALVMGGRMLDECVVKYGRPGMAVKFLSPRAIELLGMRGYQVVKDEKGDVVKAGTLLMAEIPHHIAERRRRSFVKESEDAVRNSEQSYNDAVENLRAQARDLGVQSLTADDLMTAEATEKDESLLGQTRPGGVRIGRDMRAA